MPRPFRQQVLGIAAMLAIVVVGALLYASRVTYQEQVQHLRAEAFAMSNTVVAYLERNLESADDVAMVAARHPDVQLLRPEAAGHVLQPLVRGDRVIRNALIADVSGRVIAWARPPQPELEGRLQAEWLRGVAASAERTIGPVLGAPEQTEHAVATGYPIRDANGTVEGVLALELALPSASLPNTLYLLPVTERPFFLAQGVPVLMNDDPWMDTVKAIGNTEHHMVGLVMTDKTDADLAMPADFAKIGTIVRMHHPVRNSGKLQFIAEGLRRVRIVEWLSEQPPFMARVEYPDDVLGNEDELRAYAIAIINTLKELVPLNPLYSEKLKFFLNRFNPNEPSTLTDFGGQVEPFEQQRTKKRALSRLVEVVTEQFQGGGDAHLCVIRGRGGAGVAGPGTGIKGKNPRSRHSNLPASPCHRRPCGAENAGRGVFYKIRAMV